MKKISAYLIMFAFFFLLVLQNNIISAIDVTKHQTFDALSPGSLVDDGVFKTAHKFKVIGSGSLSLPNCLDFTYGASANELCNGFLNITGLWSKFTFFLKFTQHGGAAATQVVNIMFKDATNTTLDYIKYYDLNGGSTTLSRGSDNKMFYTVSWASLPTWRNITLTRYGSYINASIYLQVAPYTYLGGCNFSISTMVSSFYITIATSTNAYNPLYFDDFTINVASFDDYNYGNLNIYDGIGNTIQTSYEGIIYPDIEKIYNMPINTTLKGIDIQVSNSQYIDYNLTNYFLYLNNQNMSNPSYFFINPYGIGYILRWVFTATIDANNLVFEFYHNRVCSGNVYWYVFDGYPNTLNDLDQPYPDNFIHYRYGHQPGYPIFIYHFDGAYDATYQSNYDLAMKFYYQDIQIIEEGSPFSFDKITTSKLTFKEYENIPLFYYVSDMTYTNYIYVYNTTGQLIIEDFPYTISSFYGYTGFLPFKSGWYRFELVRNSVKVSSINITVTVNSDNYILASYPNPSGIEQSYYLYYKYYRTDNKNGMITVYWNKNATIQEIQENGEIYTIPYNTSSSILLQGNFGYDVYFKLYAEISNGTYTLLTTHRHYVIGPEDITSISVKYKTSSVLKGESLIQTFYAYQNAYPLTYIYLNGNNIKDISGTYNIDFTYTLENLQQTKFYKASIIQITINGSIELTNCTFIITVSDSGGGGTEGQIAMILPPPFSYIAGLVLTLVCLMIPLIVLRKAQVEGDLIRYIPAFCGLLGFIVSCLIGFFPWYSLFGLLFAFVVIVVIMWQRSKIAS